MAVIICAFILILRLALAELLGCVANIAGKLLPVKIIDVTQCNEFWLLHRDSGRGRIAALKR
jgi:hypothetical protein